MAKTVENNKNAAAYKGPKAAEIMKMLCTMQPKASQKGRKNKYKCSRPNMAKTGENKKKCSPPKMTKTAENNTNAARVVAQQ